MLPPPCRWRGGKGLASNLFESLPARRHQRPSAGAGTGARENVSGRITPEDAEENEYVATPPAWLRSAGRERCTENAGPLQAIAAAVSSGSALNDSGNGDAGQAWV